MNDSITQMRLSMRLAKYLINYTEKDISADSLYRDEWDTVWTLADVARLENTLTPELVDDVRIALGKFEVSKGMLVLPLFPEL